MPKTLILITNHFPFGPAESFVETEFAFLEKKFDQIFILTRDITSEGVRGGNYDYYRFNPVSNTSEKILVPFLFIKHIVKIWQLITSEWRHLKKKGRKVRLSLLLHDLSKALITSTHINTIIKANNLSGNIVLYSYWLTSSALATIFVQSRRCSFVKISRAHGGDVYEERHTGKYLTFRNPLAKHLDAIYCISQNGLEYLKSKVDNSLHKKLLLARLGSAGQGITQFDYRSKRILVSCSFILPVKRIDFLIDALSLIREEIEWIHIGDGPIGNEIKSYADKKLSSLNNIQFQFKGFLSSSEMQSFYNNTPVYLFLNTSSFEGIPVTMMEAQSFGIPILGLNVGGVGEIVNSANGRLLPADVSHSAYAGALAEFLCLPETDIKTLREQAWANWNTHYNAEKNFSTFADQISDLH